jgi:hypothetical protein
MDSRIYADLAQRILKGDTEAEGDLCALLAPGIRQILHRWLRDFARTEELAQDVLIIVLRRLRAQPLAEPSQGQHLPRSRAR